MESSFVVYSSYVILFPPGMVLYSNVNYWTRLSKISGFVRGEQINYLPLPKAEANN